MIIIPGTAMKNYAMLFFVLIFLTLDANAQNINDSLFVDGLGEKFDAKDNITFVIHNDYNSDLFFSISLQEKVDDKWIDVLSDIFQDKFSKITNLYPLKRNDMKPIVWNTYLIPRVSVDDSDESPRPICGCFRFVIKWQMVNDVEWQQNFSADFQITGCNK